MTGVLKETTQAGALPLVILADPTTGNAYSAAPSGSAAKQQLVLLAGVSAIGPGSSSIWNGGAGVCDCTAANFNSDTVQLEYLASDGTTYIAAGPDTTFTNNNSGQFNIPATASIRGNVITGGVGNPTTVTLGVRSL